MAATAQTIAGHPIAMKVGGRRMSISKSPAAQKSFLAGSPPKQAEVPKPAADTTTEDDKANPTSPTATHKEDDYPRPDGHHETKEEQEQKKKEEQHQANKKKEKKEFEHVKQQNFNKNPPAQNNFNIKQPAGKTM